MCYICERLTVDNELCPICRQEIDRNNESVYLLSLLADAIKYPLPVYLRERIEKVLNTGARKYKGVRVRVKLVGRGVRRAARDSKASKGK